MNMTRIRGDVGESSDQATVALGACLQHTTNNIMATIQTDAVNLHPNPNAAHFMGIPPNIQQVRHRITVVIRMTKSTNMAKRMIALFAMTMSSCSGPQGTAKGVVIGWTQNPELAAV